MVAPQYPDTIKLTIITESIYDPITGNWSDPIEEVVIIPCRFVPSGGKLLKLQDGSELAYNYKVAIPKGSITNIPSLTNFIGFDELGVEIMRGQTIMYHNGFYHSVLWV